MHFLPTVLIVLTGSAAAFTLPFQATEGDYVAYFNTEGVEVHRPISEYTISNASTIDTNDTITASSFDGAIRKRALVFEDHYYCGCSYDMNHGDCDSAVAALKGQFDAQPNGIGMIKRNSAWYSIRGGVVAFFCNEQASQTFEMTNPWYGDVLARITGRCGWYIAGTDRIVVYQIGSPLPGFASGAGRLGYMRMYNGLDFCTAAIGSSQHSC